jgi:acetyl-CoA acetyltransferase
MRDVAVLGVGMHPWGKFNDKPLTQMCRESIEMALKDAGVEWTDIQGVAAGSSRFSGGYGWGLNGNEVGLDMGMTGVPIYNLSAGCSAGGHAFNMAYTLVASGQCDIALAMAGEKMPRGFIPLTGDEADPLDIQYLQFVCAGMTGPAFWAMLTRRRMEEYGTTEETLAKVAVKAHANSVHNPNARYRREFTLEEVLNSALVSYPLRLYEICPVSDGAAAAVLCSAEEARKRTKDPVWVAASTVATAQFGDGVPKGVAAVAAAPHAQHSEVTSAVRKAFSVAGMSPADVDFLELQDNTVYYELAFPEEWGFCEPGQAEWLVNNGETAPNGKLPINPSGGFLSFGEATTAMGIWEVCELVWQLRGQAGARQVRGAKVGLSQTIGLGGNATAVILKR